MKRLGIKYERHLAFLKARLESENYKASVSEECYLATKKEYEEAKLNFETHTALSY